jgi:biotin carboxyl carrier protein
MKYITTVDGQEYNLEILDDQRLLINGVEYEVDFESLSGQPVYSLLINGKSFEGLVYSSENEWEVLLHGALYNIQVEDERERRLRVAAGSAAAEQSEFHLKAPMPGLVISVSVSEGQEVEKGEVLVILESMKMQNELKSPRPGRITRVRVTSGDSVDHKDTLLTVE